MHYLLCEEEYAEYQALKSEEVGPVVVTGNMTNIEMANFVQRMFAVCKVEPYDKVEELGKEYIGIEIPQEIVPEVFMKMLIARGIFRNR